MNSNAALLMSASVGFDLLFSNDAAGAQGHFSGKDDPFHLLGLGVCTFLEAALGMEAGLLSEASRCLGLSEAGTRKYVKSTKDAGLEWEILNADAVILLGLTHALSESYMGYLQCMYLLNSAHSKFTKLYKTVFPSGLDAYVNPIPDASRKPSLASLIPSPASSSSALSVPTPPRPKSNFLGRFIGIAAVSSAPVIMPHATKPQGPVEEFIIAGAAFGCGLFNLMFSLLPKKVQSLVGFFGFKHDRQLALKALRFAAAQKDVHSVFAGLVLMTYHGMVLLLSGYQADEARVLEQYKAIVDEVEKRYPDGALWTLNRAKILRMSHDATGAIRVLQAGLKPERPHTFAQAENLLVFELAWTLLAQRKYKEAAEMFIRVTEHNSWSDGTYYFIAAGCHFSIGDYEKAQRLLDAIPDLINKKKIGGKEIPTEVFIKKKLAFYKDKQMRRRGSKNNFVESIKISPAEEIGIFWNTHSRIDRDIALTHIATWATLTPVATISSSVSSRVRTNPAASSSTTLATSTATIAASPTSNVTASLTSTGREPDLDTPDELAVRALLLGITHRSIGDFTAARTFLLEAHKQQPNIRVSTWVGGVAMFELAVLDLKEAEAEGGSWSNVLTEASAKLDVALGLATSSTDLSSRLDSRISMLRDEIAAKRELLELSCTRRSKQA